MTEPDEITTALAVIDGTLSGEAVGAEHAELAELALLLADGREAPEASFAASLDRRAARRFAPEPTPDGGPAAQRHRWRWLFAPGATAGLAAIVALIFVLGSGSRPRPVGASAKSPSNGGAASALAPSASAASTSTSSASASSPPGSARVPAAGASLGDDLQQWRGGIARSDPVHIRTADRPVRPARAVHAAQPSGQRGPAGL